MATSPYAPGGMYGTNTSQWNPTKYPTYGVSVRPPPRPTAAQLSALNPSGVSNFGWTTAQGADYGRQMGTGWGGGGAGGRMVNPDYSGILGSFTADARARFGAGLEAMKAQRLSGAKGAINRLGVRDPKAMLEKMRAYGLTEADLQGAADNPWSELKALDFQKRGEWNNAVANRAARGGFRSGGTIGARGRIDQNAARGEALLTQNTLDELSQGLFQEKEWERQQRDQMEQSIAQQQASLAAAYQPYWQPD